MNEILQNGQYNGIASGSPYSVLAVQDTSNSSQLEGHASDKNNGRLFEPQTQDCNRQKICESFVVYTDNRKSIPIQDMVYTRTPKPYAEIESVV